MIHLLLFFGLYFIVKGILLIQGRTVPKGVREKLTDQRSLKGWCTGTGTVHILWGVSAALLWCANQFIPYALYALVLFAVSAVSSVVVMLRTTGKYTNKR